MEKEKPTIISTVTSDPIKMKSNKRSKREIEEILTVFEPRRG